MPRFNKYLSFFIIFSIVLALFPYAYAQDAPELQRYIVILEEPALYSDERPQVFVRNVEEHNDEVRKALTELQNDIKSQIPLSMTLNSEEDVFNGEFSYTDVLNGFTITTDSETAELIKNIEGVKEVFPDEVIACAEDDAVPYAESYSATEAGFSAANPGNELNVQYAYEKGYNGEGRVVAILDSTINYNNSYFNLSDETSVKYTAESLSQKMAEKGINKDAIQSYKTAKVPYVYDYVNNTYSTTSTSQHGTHVSGIVAGYETKVGDGKITGIAPESQIMFFGVTSSNGNISFSVAAAALEDAVKLEADAINMSFGGDYFSENRSGSAYTAFRTAARNAENAGCMVSKSAGNQNKGKSTETKDIDYSASDNTLFPNVANIGSVHGKYRVAKGLTDENGVVYGCESKSSVSKFPLSEIADCKHGTDADVTEDTILGKVAVITVPDEVMRESDYTYYSRVLDEGVTALILIDNNNQIPVSSVSNSYRIPVFHMTKSEGEKLLANAKKISCVGKLTISENSANITASETSSYGYSDTLDISVDYSAVGGNVYSAYGSSVAGMSGTSMAAPSASGASILMYQYIEEKYPSYRGSAKVDLVKNLIASTTETVYEENGAMASPRKVGSGVIQLDKAMQSGVIVHNETNVNRITLGDEIGKEFTLNFYVSNISDKPITFDKIETELSTDDYKYYESKNIYAFYGLKKLNATVSGTEKITVQPESTAQVSLTVKLDDNDISYLEKAMVNGFFVDGKVTLSNTQGEHVSVGIPFTGFYGDWEKYSVVDETNMNTDFLFRTEMDYCTVDNIIKKSEDGYVLPFTTDPDEFVQDSALSYSLRTRKNSFLRIKADGKKIFEGFVQKNLAFNLKTFVTKNGAVSETLKKNGKVVWEFYFMSPLHKTESEAQLIKIKVTPQNEKPEFGEITVTESGGKKYLYTYANGKDLRELVCVGHSVNGAEKVSSVTVSGSTGFTAFSIDGFSDATLMAYDSALNSVAEYPGITMSVEDNTAIFKNNTFEPLSCTGIIAVYGSDGKMEKIDVLTDDNTVIDGYHKVEKDISNYKDKEYRIFFWEDKILKPIS